MEPLLPFGFADQIAFFALPAEEKPPHIWECLQYLEWGRSSGQVAEEAIERNQRILRHVAFDVARDLAGKLQLEGAYKNRFDPRWPRFRPNSKDPLYLTGCHPPLRMCAPPEEDMIPEFGGDADMVEFAEWLYTPAGMHVSDEAIREQITAMAENLRESFREEERTRKEAIKAREELHKLMRKNGLN